MMEVKTQYLQSSWVLSRTWSANMSGMDDDDDMDEKESEEM